MPIDQNQAARFLIDRELRQYLAALQRWSQQVLASTDLLAALRLAAHKPARGHLIASLRSLGSTEQARAHHAVEHHLMALTSHLGSDDHRIPQAMRLAAGHWPRVHAEIDRKRRS